MQFDLAPFALPSGYGESVLSLADFKAHLKIEHADEDDYLELCRDAAVEMVEQYCGLYLAPRTGVVWSAESVARRMDLGVGPINALTSIAWLDGDAVDQSGEIGDWRVLGKTEIALKPGADMPTDAVAAVTITFDAGFDDATRPAALVRAAMMFGAHLWRHREAVMGGAAMMEVPFGFKQRCGPYRRVTI